MSSSIDLSNDLMNIQYEISEFASIDHLRSVWLNGLEMMMELTNKGADSQEFNKAVESFTKSIRQNKNRDDKRDSDPLRNAGYEFCDAISLVFNDLSKKAKEKQLKKQIALIRPVQQSQSSKATRETRSSKKKKIFLERRFEENVAQPIEPLRLLRCGDCPAIFKNNSARLEHRKMHAIEGPSVSDAVKSRTDRKRKAIHSADEDEMVAIPVKNARLATVAPSSNDELQCEYCDKKYKTTRWLYKHLEEKHNVIV
ncbi:hypothetical protein PRIPAC_84762 [Pristionchus pacificus]|uniref:Zinc finger protein n=1 Tax=Pristionchus pacificus TaxID=54126 RepID=A0A2A6BM97_PRIPA|nr:hypothetical protein PRIPAC_84762 [Pristionchus pacificus]|eukprot:PDM67027.1 zinc finger protein [Pristionchus pacificus]